MILREKILFHQVHPAKLATDVGCAAISLYFFWQHQLGLALLTHFVPPPVASALVIRFTNLDRIKESPLGHYLARYMTPVVQAIRLAGDLIMIAAAWLQSPVGISAGILLVLSAWSYGLLLMRRA